MPRVDVWDIPDDKEDSSHWVGYARNLEEIYSFGRELGQGGFGTVRVVINRETGKEYACKSIQKKLDLPFPNPSREQQHLENIKREASILMRLRGTLNVVYLEDVFEDDTYVHMVMEYCRGGELVHRIGTRHYTERTVASFMRACLRTLAQCHHHRILHRDIKPGNFMLLTEADDAPIKALDFGLAVFFDPKKLPRTDLGLEGTPWYMAPEQLSSQSYPASDCWAAGVMAFQLLSGEFPFNDWRNKRSPALSLVWRSILTEEVNFSKPGWEDISDEAKDFCRTLLTKDPLKRPSAREALTHPWLKGEVDQRHRGVPLRRTVVQRLQRFGVENAFRRTVLDMIANELINKRLEGLKQQQKQQQQQHIMALQQQQQLLIEASGKGEEGQEKEETNVARTHAALDNDASAHVSSTISDDASLVGNNQNNKVISSTGSKPAKGLLSAALSGLTSSSSPAASTFSSSSSAAAAAASTEGGGMGENPQGVPTAPLLVPTVSPFASATRTPASPVPLPLLTTMSTSAPAAATTGFFFGSFRSPRA
eukprot:CAMPEP_0175055060 /NCGR_PEP_ID=MMETSP0052_2-20121109/9860_1 /TAXON_ID=51329 ORGANISM="Polytomella parva, Strain SAG 63-3" /NCGR_SAMPLE_ID=MMETSP0052_2 /ASSEMBLY_ACC=CAM_ASM_000194 /LENGTH=537 /DNA_ID=CAMNT_0016319843 /DNA_START=31 /DNA_END=1640 /DNA_ORIENTATION=+